jgi:ribosomal RNA-processing protein 8
MNQVFNISNSDTIHEKIQKDPQYLVRYHEKMAEKMKTWIVDPVKVIVNKINRLAPERVINEMVIGDFGCGKARLAELLNKNKVYNFDHHNILNEKIIACDMKKHHLKNKLDVAVFSLSLMGQNWIEYITEAKRCLVKNGWLFIAETANQLNARLSTLKDEITKQGFEIRSEKREGDFTFIEAMKL